MPFSSMRKQLRKAAFGEKLRLVVQFGLAALVTRGRSLASRYARSRSWQQIFAKTDIGSKAWIVLPAHRRSTPPSGACLVLKMSRFPLPRARCRSSMPTTAILPRISSAGSESSVTGCIRLPRTRSPRLSPYTLARAITTMTILTITITITIMGTATSMRSTRIPTTTNISTATPRPGQLHRSSPVPMPMITGQRTAPGGARPRAG